MRQIDVIITEKKDKCWGQFLPDERFESSSILSFLFQGLLWHL